METMTQTAMTQFLTTTVVVVTATLMMMEFTRLILALEVVFLLLQGITALESRQGCNSFVPWALIP